MCMTTIAIITFLFLCWSGLLIFSLAMILKTIYEAKYGFTFLSVFGLFFVVLLASAVIDKGLIDYWTKTQCNIKEIQTNQKDQNEND